MSNPQAELKWHSVNGNTTAYNITLANEDVKKYKFGISATKLMNGSVVSSGLEWTDCTYHIDKRKSVSQHPVKYSNNIYIALVNDLLGSTG